MIKVSTHNSKIEVSGLAGCVIVLSIREAAELSKSIDSELWNSLQKITEELSISKSIGVTALKEIDKLNHVIHEYGIDEFEGEG